MAYIWCIIAALRGDEGLMGTTQPGEKVTRFCAITFSAPADMDRVLDDVKARFGTAASSYGPVPFSAFTGYYAGEMGENLEKVYLTFAGLVDRDGLARAKLDTNEIEREYSANGRRTVNLDPGYLARDKLVLATTKDFFHRLYLADGIYAEVTLHYRQGRFRYFSWTYADYKEPAFLAFLEKARARLVGELRKK
ncbi:MAG: DUF4416 family protein [Chitinivibrionales bacterium]|nr:DUF4416 family protein [Chitinivibrionales bacterium]MBD3395886.1 DUF4416 family protein [Chitinivibrionales bacterium]